MKTRNQAVLKHSTDARSGEPKDTKTGTMLISTNNEAQNVEATVKQSLSVK